jgi:hypothetical protein
MEAPSVTIPTLTKKCLQEAKKMAGLCNLQASSFIGRGGTDKGYPKKDS